MRNQWNWFFRVDRKPEQASGEKHESQYVKRVVKMMRCLYHLTENKSKEKRSHLPEKIHCPGHGTGIVPANVCAYGIGDHHTEGERKISANQAACGDDIVGRYCGHQK